MVTVRKAAATDAQTIARFNQAMARETEDKSLDDATVQAGVRAVFEDSRRGFYLVAETEDCIAGCLLITYEWSDWRNGDFWWIQSVFVHPDFRREGVYRALHGRARELAADAGVVGIRLYVERDNDRAQQAYRTLGMKECAYLMFEETLDE